MSFLINMIRTCSEMNHHHENMMMKTGKFSMNFSKHFQCMYIFEWACVLMMLHALFENNGQFSSTNKIIDYLIYPSEGLFCEAPRRHVWCRGPRIRQRLPNIMSESGNVIWKLFQNNIKYFQAYFLCFLFASMHSFRFWI